MEFRPNVSPVDVIKKGAFGGTYFRDIYSCVTGKFYKNSWKEFKELEDIDHRYYCSDFYDVSLNKYGVECGTSLRFWEIVSRFFGVLNKLISKGKDSLKIRKVLLRWCNELKKLEKS